MTRDEKRSNRFILDNNDIVCIPLTKDCYLEVLLTKGREDRVTIRSNLDNIQVSPRVSNVIEVSVENYE